MDALTLARQLPAACPRVRRIPLIRREIRESLSDNALEILFASAELLVEGDRDRTGDSGDSGDPSGSKLDDHDRVYATVMVTLDLRSCADLLREPADEATAERVAELMRGSAAVRRHLIALARPALAKLVDAAPRSLRIEVLPIVRTEQTRLLIDGDAVVSLSSRAKGRTRQVGG